MKFENDYKHILKIASSFILLQNQLCNNIELDIYARCINAKSGVCILLIMSESLSELQMLFSGMINQLYGKEIYYIANLYDENGFKTTDLKLNRYWNTKIYWIT